MGASSHRSTLRLSAVGIPWSVLRCYSSASAKEKARRNAICERTELLEGEQGILRRAAGLSLIRCPEWGVGVGNARDLLKDVRQSC